MINQSSQNRKVFLTEDSLEPELLVCPWCDSMSYQKEIEIQVNPDIDFRSCNGCHIGYASRQPHLSFFTKYYQNYYAGKKQNVNADSNRFAKRIVASHSPSGTVSIIDFGGGDGSVAIAMAELLLKQNTKQVNITVVDPNFQQPDCPNSSISISNLKELSQITGQFDYVIASAVLEHLKNPKTYLKELLGVLKTGGMFYARTPYLFPMANTLSKMGVSVNTQFPGHLFDMGKVFWELIPTENWFNGSYEIVKSKPSIVEKSFKKNPVNNIIGNMIKAPYKLAPDKYKTVAGWEVYICKLEK